MKTFLTEYRSIPNFERHAGENIRAHTWEAAERLAETLCVEVIGELVETVFVDEREYDFG